LFDYPPYETALASAMVDVIKNNNLDLLHVHYAIPHASAAYMAKADLKKGRKNYSRHHDAARDGYNLSKEEIKPMHRWLPFLSMKAMRSLLSPITCGMKPTNILKLTKRSRSL
jgi:hypothetical protein